MSGANRRRSRRVRIAAIAAMQTRGRGHYSDQAACTIKNISRVGVGLETGQPPLIGQGVTLRLAIDDQIHELRGRVTRVKRRGQGPFYDVGLDWSGCSSEELAFLESVLGNREHSPLA